jgi:hypothetical protein
LNDLRRSHTHTRAHTHTHTRTHTRTHKHAHTRTHAHTQELLVTCAPDLASLLCALVGDVSARGLQLLLPPFGLTLLVGQGGPPLEMLAPALHKLLALVGCLCCPHTHACARANTHTHTSGNADPCTARAACAHTHTCTHAHTHTHTLDLRTAHTLVVTRNSKHRAQQLLSLHRIAHTQHTNSTFKPHTHLWSHAI